MSIGRINEDPERLARYMREHNPPCPGCGYSLEGLSSRVCPECGRELSVAAFMRARRRTNSPPEWMHGLTTAAAISLIVLLLSMFSSFPWWLIATALLILIVFVVSFGVWYWRSGRG